eukprot:681528-Pelagomonas_calceolata.AAC.7
MLPSLPLLSCCRPHCMHVDNSLFPSPFTTGSTEVAADCACFDTCQLHPLLQHCQQQRLLPSQHHQHQHQLHPYPHSALPSVPAGTPIANTAILIAPLAPSPLPSPDSLPQGPFVSEPSPSACQIHKPLFDPAGEAPTYGTKLSTSACTSTHDGCQSTSTSACQVHPLPLNTVGEVLVGGAGVAASYISSAAAGAALPDGAASTADPCVVAGGSEISPAVNTGGSSGYGGGAALPACHTTLGSAAAGGSRKRGLQQAEGGAKRAAHGRTDDMHDTAAAAAAEERDSGLQPRAEGSRAARGEDAAGCRIQTSAMRGNSSSRRPTASETQAHYAQPWVHPDALHHVTMANPHEHSSSEPTATAARARFLQLWVHPDKLHHVAVAGPHGSSSLTGPTGSSHFNPCPGLEKSLCSREGIRFFRTGDLGCLIEDEAGRKQLVVVGRVDHQVSTGAKKRKEKR